MGAGYRRFVSPYNTVDLRGSITFSGYKRIEAEFLAPRLFDRRGVLSVLGGWREATQVGFYGIGTGPTSVDDRANYAFKQPYGSATLDFRPTRRLFVLRGGLELSQWKQEPAAAPRPRSRRSTRRRRCPGLGASPTYLHLQGTAGIDSRTSPGYARRGGFYGVTAHDFADTDDDFSFTQMDYEAIQHIPVLRDAWVLSLRGRVETTHTDDDAADAVLHAAGARRRIEPARVCQLALPRPPQPAARRRSGACWPTASSTWRCFSTPARSRRAPATSMTSTT